MMKKLLIFVCLILATLTYGEENKNWLVDDACYKNSVTVKGSQVVYDATNNLVAVCYMVNKPCGDFRIAVYNLTSKKISKSPVYDFPLDAAVDTHGTPGCGLHYGSGYFYVGGGDHGYSGGDMTVYRSRDPYSYTDLIDITENFSSNGTYMKFQPVNSTGMCAYYRSINWTRKCTNDDGLSWIDDQLVNLSFNSTHSVYVDVTPYGVGESLLTVKAGTSPRSNLYYIFQNTSGMYNSSGSAYPSGMLDVSVLEQVWDGIHSVFGFNSLRYNGKQYLPFGSGSDPRNGNISVFNGTGWYTVGGFHGFHAVMAYQNTTHGVYAYSLNDSQNFTVFDYDFSSDTLTEKRSYPGIRGTYPSASQRYNDTDRQFIVTNDLIDGIDCNSPANKLYLYDVEGDRLLGNLDSTGVLVEGDYNIEGDYRIDREVYL